MVRKGVCCIPNFHSGRQYAKGTSGAAGTTGDQGGVAGSGGGVTGSNSSSSGGGYGSMAGQGGGSSTPALAKKCTPVLLLEDCQMDAPLFYTPGKRGFYSPRQGYPSSERMNAFRNVGRWVLCCFFLLLLWSPCFYMACY